MWSLKTTVRCKTTAGQKENNYGKNKKRRQGNFCCKREKLQGCKLEEEFLKKEKENLAHLAKYLNIDETTAVFFTVIFYLQMQESSASSLSEIADFLEIPHISILIYSQNFSLLQKKFLIEQKKSESMPIL